MLRNHLSPSSFPSPWATNWGEDTYGPWLTFSLKGIRQVFRWIKPDSFLMGSPEEEVKQRTTQQAKESLHQVTLSKGFWLADTTVTQQLWQAVMKDNPSGFTGGNRPVERVSWQDAQRFLARLNSLIPGLSARLPTEAEWEYTCRAGTSTPFAFGDQITPEQVNYNGNFPYTKSEKGLYRRCTVEVKSLPCNSWGLYEMHGNVWEWCQDGWQNDLSAEPVTDPCGPENEDFRVVRGGSWVCDAVCVRSACRDRYYSNYSEGSIGFRLAG